MSCSRFMLHSSRSPSISILPLYRSLSQCSPTTVPQCDNRLASPSDRLQLDACLASNGRTAAKFSRSFCHFSLFSSRDFASSTDLLQASSHRVITVSSSSSNFITHACAPVPSCNCARMPGCVRRSNVQEPLLHNWSALTFMHNKLSPIYHRSSFF